MPKIKCDHCRTEIVGTVIRFANRNFCCAKCKADWESLLTRINREKFLNGDGNV